MPGHASCPRSSQRSLGERLAALGELVSAGSGSRSSMAGMRSHRGFLPLLLAAALGGVVTVTVIALLGAGSGSPARKASSVPRTSSGTRRNVDNTALNATQIYHQDSAGVVAITARTSEGEDKGTGIVINDQGLILTNDHVVAGATAMQVSADGSASHSASAQLVGEEANSDLAL